MQPFEVLKQFESCYEAMQPAVENHQDAYIWLSDIPHPLFNAVMHLSAENVKERVEALIEQTPMQHPLSFWVHPLNKSVGLAETLKELGFGPVITCPLMACPVRAFESQIIDIRPADGDLETFYQIVADVFHFDEVVHKRYAALMGKIKAENYLIYIDDKPVATGTLFPHGQVGGVFNIATLPKYQGKGCAKAMMRHLMDRAAKLYLNQLILLSSPVAENLYFGLGFKKILDIEIYTQQQ